MPLLERDIKNPAILPACLACFTFFLPFIHWSIHSHTHTSSFTGKTQS